MPRGDDTQHSILIVSASGQFDALVRKSLKNAITIDSRKSAALARRCLLERFYDLVLIDGPLPDESGEEYALDVAEKCSASVLLVTPQEVYGEVLERVTDHGILAIPKPFPKGALDRAIRFLMAEQSRIHRLEGRLAAAQEKLEELRLVSKAKLLLVEKKRMTEEEAHRFIGKQAMDHGVSRRWIAERLLEDLA